MSVTRRIASMRCRVATIAALAAAVLTAAAVGADESAPSIESLTGFGNAKFGSGIEDVRKVWPGMTPIGDKVKMPSAAFTSAHLQRFLIKGHKLEGLTSPVDVELRFWKERLWAFIVYFEPADSAAALQQLVKTYGERTTSTEERPIWRGEKVSLQTMPSSGWYGATDNAISDDAREWFFAALTGGRANQAPAAGATPQPAPASAAPTLAAP